MAGKFVLKNTGKKFRFTLQAGNGSVILTSESYADRSAALNGIKSVRQSARKEANFEVRTAKNGQAYFVLKASNQKVIGQSETYSAARNAKKGIASVQTHAPVANVDDQTG